MATSNQLCSELARVTEELKDARAKELAELFEAFRAEIEAYGMSQAEVLEGLGFVRGRTRRQGKTVPRRLWSVKPPRWLVARENARASKKRI